MPIGLPTGVQVGSYLFMDMQYLATGSEGGDPVYRDFTPSPTMLGTVLNNRSPDDHPISEEDQEGQEHDDHHSHDRTLVRGDTSPPGLPADLV